MEKILNVGDLVYLKFKYQKIPIEVVVAMKSPHLNTMEYKFRNLDNGEIFHMMGIFTKTVRMTKAEKFKYSLEQ